MKNIVIAVVVAVVAAAADIAVVAIVAVSCCSRCCRCRNDQRVVGNQLLFDRCRLLFLFSNSR